MEVDAIRIRTFRQSLCNLVGARMCYQVKVGTRRFKDFGNVCMDSLETTKQSRDEETKPIFR